MGIRECFHPRPGMVFAQADYSQLELRTLAQVCLHLLGESNLAKVLNAGMDPHLEVARTILGITYQEALENISREDVDNARQVGKVANFGLPGGLGVTRLCYFAKKTYGVELTEKQARELKDQWLQAFPEMKQYFQYVASLPERDGTKTMEQVYTERIRSGASYTAACNGFFQGLGADATKEAGWRICKACYSEPSSPLFGCRTVFYCHDEFLVEAPEDRGHEAAMELERLMVVGAKKYLPDLEVVAKPCLMRYYSKKAKPVWDNGRLVPWDGST